MLAIAFLLAEGDRLFEYINILVTLVFINDSPIYYDSIIGSVDITDKEFNNNDVQYADVLFQSFWKPDK